MERPLYTDEELLNQVRQGDKEAFRLLVLRYESLVAATVVGMLGQTPEADDVGQEVFIRLYRALSQYKGESKLGTYLTKIAINLSLNELKRRQRRQWLRLGKNNDKAIATPPPDTDTQQLVQWALAQLAPEFRSVVLLRLVEGYSSQQTAEILEIPLGTVLSRLARGQQKLREILQNQL